MQGYDDQGATDWIGYLVGAQRKIIHSTLKVLNTWLQRKRAREMGESLIPSHGEYR